LPSAAPIRSSRPPRVIVLTTYFRPVIGGVESTAERLARFLVRSNFDTRVVTKRIGRELADREVMDGVRVERIGSRGERGGSGKWRFVPAATRWLVAHRGDHDVVCCIDYRGIGCAALAARSVTHHPVVFQAQTGGVLSAGNVDAALERFGIGSTGWAGRVVKAAVSAVYARADAFACISREIERETVAAGIDTDRIHFLPNPIDMTQFRPAEPAARAQLRQAMGIGPDRVVCIFVGRLSMEKGLMELLEAWRLLPRIGPRESPNAPLLLVAGPDMPGHPWDLGAAARIFVERHELGESVRFMGPLRDPAPALQVSDVAAVPSHFEALGLSGIEALATGVPVVASAVGGLPDFVVDGVNGALCPPKQPEALAERLGRLLDDGELRARLAANARSSVLGHYDEQIVFANFAALLSRLAGH
jgi:glycosyltransferase involved in cell wall biosynthesis